MTRALTCLDFEPDEMLVEQALLQKQERRRHKSSGKELHPHQLIDMDTASYNSVKEVIGSISRTYENSIIKFTKDLPPQAHVDLRFLIFRLDFAELYMRKEETNQDEDFDEPDTFRSH